MTTIEFLEALYDPEVLFLVFPFVVDGSSASCDFLWVSPGHANAFSLLVFEKLKRRSGSSLPSGKLHVFAWDECDLAVRDKVVELIREQNYRTHFF